MINEYVAGQSDTRPWGDWTVLDAGPGYAVKRIRVHADGVLSVQRHKHRSERWVVVAGTARVRRGDATFDLAVGEATEIGLGEVHSIANAGPEEMVFIEIQTGAVLSEDDIERLQDRYGRA